MLKLGYFFALKSPCYEGHYHHDVTKSEGNPDYQKCLVRTDKKITSRRILTCGK